MYFQSKQEEKTLAVPELCDEESSPEEDEFDDGDDDVFEAPKKKKKKKSNVSNKSGKLSLQCTECKATFSRRGNLTRHHRRAHKDKDLSTGKCICLDCGKKFQKIFLLREHLAKEHAMIFDMEINHHENEQGFRAFFSCYII